MLMFYSQGRFFEKLCFGIAGDCFDLYSDKKIVFTIFGGGVVNSECMWRSREPKAESKRVIF